MAVQPHTHTFEIPTASAADVATGTATDLAVVPASLGSAAASDAGDFANATQGALAETALQPATIGVTVQAYSADLQDIADGTRPFGDMEASTYDPQSVGGDTFDRFYHHGLDNFSMPLALNSLVIYITTTGSDTISGPTHGTTAGAAFLTLNAAINFVKKNYRFTGRLSTVEFRFGPGNWGVFALGSNLDQGEDYYPFSIHVTSVDNANRARFDGVSNGCWNPTYVYATKIKAGYFAVTRRNAMTVNDVDIVNTVPITYCFRAAFGAKLNVFGTINFAEAVSFPTALIYCQDNGYVSLENGDSPLIFPEANFTNVGNVATPLIYRMVTGSTIFCPANPHADLIAISGGAYYVDASSTSTQTTAAQNLDDNTANGGPVVARTGTDTAGSETYADGKFRQWGILSVSGAAVGQSSPASALLTFPTPFGANPRIRYNWSVPAGGDVSVNAPQPSATSLQFVVTNRGASAASFSIYWEASGRVA